MFYQELQSLIVGRVREGGCEKEALEGDLRSLLDNYVWSPPQQRYVGNSCYYFIDSKLSFRMEDLRSSTFGAFPHPRREEGKVFFSLQLICPGLERVGLTTHLHHHVWISVAGHVVELELSEDSSDKVEQGESLLCIERFFCRQSFFSVTQDRSRRCRLGGSASIFSSRPAPPLLERVQDLAFFL